MEDVQWTLATDDCNGNPVAPQSYTEATVFWSINPISALDAGCAGGSEPVPVGVTAVNVVPQALATSIDLPADTLIYFRMQVKIGPDASYLSRQVQRVTAPEAPPPPGALPRPPTLLN